MPIRHDVPTGAPCWVDLLSSDVDRSVAFYAALFGWTAEDPADEFGGYRNLQLHGERVAGLMSASPPMTASDVWSVYLAVEDAAATVEAARQAGSEVVVEPMPVGDLGVMAVVTDPGGAVIGMWQPGEHRGGVFGTAGAPYHVELHTRDYAETVAFYESVFAWKATPQGDDPSFRYTLFDVGEGESAGIMDATGFLPDDVPAHWSVYFAVDDVDAALARVGELGGATVMAAETTPYGRLATASDSTGAVFKLHQRL